MVISIKLNFCVLSVCLSYSAAAIAFIPSLVDVHCTWAKILLYHSVNITSRFNLAKAMVIVVPHKRSIPFKQQQHQHECNRQTFSLS